MPQLEQIDTYLSQVFWLLVTFGVLFVFLRRVALPRIAGVLESRRERIEADLDKAANLKAESETILAEYEAAMADGRSRALAVVRKAADEMAQQAARQNAALGGFAGRLCIGTIVTVLPLPASGGAGTFHSLGTIPNLKALVGAKLRLQAALKIGFGLSPLSNGLEITIGN